MSLCPIGLLGRNDVEPLPNKKKRRKKRKNKNQKKS